MARAEEIRRETAQRRIAVLVTGKEALIKSVQPALEWEQDGTFREQYQKLYAAFDALIRLEAIALAAL